MAAATLKLGKQKFVVIPEGEYRQLKAKATGNAKAPKSKRRMTKQDRGDVAEAKRRLAEPGRIPLDQLTRELGLDPASFRK
ncbi:MAG: hypothetical protein WBD40_04195 [Tepidisphaeraceae bacterium]